jgi:hypothetical protein
VNNLTSFSNWAKTITLLRVSQWIQISVRGFGSWDVLNEVELNLTHFLAVNEKKLEQRSVEERLSKRVEPVRPPPSAPEGSASTGAELSQMEEGEQQMDRTDHTGEEPCGVGEFVYQIPVRHNPITSVDM